MTKPVLGVGWDVGGWIGRKQGVAVVESLADGSIVWRGAARPFRLAELGSQDWSMLELIRMAWRDADKAVLRSHRLVLAIDAPLGFPVAFAEFVVSGQAPALDSGGPEIENPLAYRETDRQVFRTFRKKPLSSSFDKLGNNTTVAMHHARRLAKAHGMRLLPFDKEAPDCDAIIEVYPALSKVRGGHVCEPGIGNLMPGYVVPGSDAGDACICALLALAYDSVGRTKGLPKLVGPPTPVSEAVQAEGWIYHPPRDWG